MMTKGMAWTLIKMCYNEAGSGPGLVRIVPK